METTIKGYNIRVYYRGLYKALNLRICWGPVCFRNRFRKACNILESAFRPLFMETLPIDMGRLLCLPHSQGQIQHDVW